MRLMSFGLMVKVIFPFFDVVQRLGGAAMARQL